MDSFGSKTLRNIGEMARLRGATTVIVGIQPDVAFAMVKLGMGTGSVHTALDLEEGLSCLDSNGFCVPSDHDCCPLPGRAARVLE